MTRFIIIRHGYSEANDKSIFAGVLDAPLTEIGRRQGELVSLYVAEHYKVDAIYSSPLSRARDTVAELAKRTGLPVLIEDGLHEIYGGEWEAMTFEELPRRYPEAFKIWEDSLGLSRPTGGESYAEVRDRMLKTMEKIARDNNGKTVVVVSHSLAIRAFCNGVLSVPLEKIDHGPDIPNASLTSVFYENGRWTIEFLGKADHLGDVVTKLPANL